ncbi:MAG: hypothetical protein ABJ327_11625 [Litoreibacter sp.]
MKIILHVGLPKTGTTSFQTYLMDCYSVPTADGVWYAPLGQTKRAPQQVKLGHALRDGDLSELAHDLKSFDGKAECLILSDESIYVETPAIRSATRQRFQQIMAPHDVTLVGVTRDLDRWKRSFYIQALEMRRSKAKLQHATANGMWQTPLSYNDFYDGAYAAQICDPPALMDKIAEMVSASQLLTPSYDDDGDIVATLRQLLDLRQTPPTSKLRKNPSLSDVQAEILRQANGQAPINGRMIRALINLDNGIPLRPRHRENLMVWRSSFDWSSLTYRSNPPLRYTLGEFDAKLATLKKYTADLR